MLAISPGVSLYLLVLSLSLFWAFTKFPRVKTGLFVSRIQMKSYVILAVDVAGEYRDNFHANCG
jgi:hypothetical protein